MNAAERPGYQPTPLGWLPLDWRVQRLSSLAKSYAGGTPDRSKPEYFDGDIPWVKSGEINLRKITQTEERISKIALSESAAKIAESGSVLVAMYGATAGKVARLKIDAAINQAVLSIRTVGNELDNDFLFWVIENSAEKLLSMCQGAAQPNLSKGLIDGLEIAIPPLPEQQKIATVLNVVDDKLDVIARQIEATQTLNHGLMQTLFSRGVGTQDANGNWVPHTKFQEMLSLELPAAWHLARLGDIAPLIRRPVEINPDATYPELGLRSYGKGTFHKPALLGTDVGNKRLFEIKAGDLLFSNVFAWEGAVAVAKHEDDGRFGSHRYITCTLDKSRADTAYVFRYMTTPAGIASLTQASPGGAGRNKTLGLSALANITMPLPPLAEQEKISQILDDVDTKLQMLESKQSAVKSLKRGLMQKLLTGEWRVMLDSPIGTA